MLEPPTERVAKFEPAPFLNPLPSFLLVQFLPPPQVPYIGSYYSLWLQVSMPFSFNPFPTQYQR
jgi:hypothetical protein